MPDDSVFLLGSAAYTAKSAEDILEELTFKARVPEGQANRVIEEAHEGNLTYIPFPFGLDPSELAALFHADPTHHACCVLKARAILANEWRLVRKDGVPAQPPEELIRRVREIFPDGLDAVLYPAALDYEVLGNAYLEVIRQPGTQLGRVVRVAHVPAFSVRRLPPDHPSGCAYVQIYGGREVYFREYGQAEPRRLPDQGLVTELIHVRNTGGLSAQTYWYGIPDIVSALRALYGLRKAMDYLAGHLAAKGVPNYLLILEGAGSSPNQIDIPTINRYFNEALEKGPGKIVVIPTPPSIEARLQALTLGVSTRETIDFIHECRDQIARAHGVPLRLLSILEAGQLGSTGEAQAQLEFFKRYVVRPRQALWEEIVTSLIIGDEKEWEEWQIRFGEITLDDVLRQLQADSLAVRHAIMTPNEARMRHGFAPVPEGDELLLLWGGEPVPLRDVTGVPPAEPEESEEKARASSVVQSLLFDKEEFTAEEALAWAERHGLQGVLVDSPGKYWRVRVRDPAGCKRRSFRTIDFGKGIRAIICRPAFPDPTSKAC